MVGCSGVFTPKLLCTDLLCIVLLHGKSLLRLVPPSKELATVLAIILFLLEGTTFEESRNHVQRHLRLV